MDKEKIKVLLSINTTINPQTNCWEWKSISSKNPYGRLWLGKRRYKAHRLSAYVYLDYDIHDTSKLICHKCNNPACINPDHLYIGTDSSNITDSVEANTHPQAVKTHCSKGHEYSLSNTTNINDERRCRSCIRAAKKKYYNKTKGANTHA